MGVSHLLKGYTMAEKQNVEPDLIFFKEWADRAASAPRSPSGLQPIAPRQSAGDQDGRRYPLLMSHRRQVYR
jgi:hypothetical protein